MNAGLYTGFLIEAFRCAFWMLRFGASSPKRTRLWSNSRGIRHFANARPLTKHEREKRGGVATLATSSFGRDGKKKFTGKKDALRKSGCLGLQSIAAVTMTPMIEYCQDVSNWFWPAVRTQFGKPPGREGRGPVPRDARLWGCILSMFSFSSYCRKPLMIRPSPGFYARLAAPPGLAHRGF